MKCKCDFCGKEFNIKPSQFKKNKTHCCSKDCSYKLKQILYKGKNNPNYGNRGSDNNLFKGDKILTSNGYIKIYKPDHPLSDKNGRILEHRYIAEQILATEGQLININGTNVLNPDLVVHHKDEDKTNNNPNNLIILTEQEHANIHQGKKHKDNTVVKKCLNCGKEFEVIKSRNDSAKFCCIKCSNIYRSKDIIETKCPICGNTFYHSKNENRTCCSVECSNKFLNRGMIEFKCDYCKKKSKMKLSRFNKSKKHYCCSECYHKDRKGK